jgi:hypothetical protein
MRIFFFITALLLLNGCKPSAYPAQPDYSIKKPKVRYTPDKKNLKKMVKQLQGSPYVWAEEGPNYFDCSGFTYYLYGSMGIEIPRVAREQAKVGKHIKLKDLQYGDLIFFATDRHHPRKITHVGMYLGDGWFTHASTVKKEVIYSNLYTSPYYKKHLRVCRRYLPKTSENLASNKSQSVWSPSQETAAVPTQQHIAKAVPQGKAILIKAPMKALQQPASHKGTYYVQVGSFIGRPKSALLYLISRNGLSYKILSFPKSGKSVSKLLIGPYQTRSKALEVRKKVRKKIQKDAFIAEIR